MRGVAEHGADERRGKGGKGEAMMARERGLASAEYCEMLLLARVVVAMGIRSPNTRLEHVCFDASWKFIYRNCVSVYCIEHLLLKPNHLD